MLVLGIHQIYMAKEDNKEWRATIPYNDRRFRELAKLDLGQFVVASGIMLEIGAYKPVQKRLPMLLNK